MIRQIVCACFLFCIVFYAGFAQAAGPTTFWLPAKGVVRLGEGYSLISGKFLQNESCVTFNTEEADANSAEWTLVKSDTLEGSVSHGSMSVDAAYSSAGIKLSGGGGTSHFASQFAQNSILTGNLIIRRKEVSAYGTAISAYSLTECGTHYVSRINYGASILFEASAAKADSKSVDVQHSNFELSAAGNSGKANFFNSVEKWGSSAFLKQHVAVTGMTKMPDFAGSSTDENFKKLLAFLHEMSDQNSGIFSQRVDQATVELTPYAQIPGSDLVDTVGPMMEWVDYLVGVLHAEVNPKFYADGLEYQAGGTTNIISAEKQRVVEMLKSGRKNLDQNGELTAALMNAPPESIPPPGKLDARFDAQDGNSQNECSSVMGNSPVLLELHGGWNDGSQNRPLCDGTQGGGGGMICLSRGEILNIVDPQDGKKIWLLGRGGITTFWFDDYGGYSGNTSSIKISCRPYFSLETRRAMAEKADVCSSPVTAAAASANCHSYLYP